MFDKYLIVEDSLRATADGFTFDARLGYYRGLGLSMIEDIAVTIDQQPVPREAIRFDETGGGGAVPLTLAEMETAYDRRWKFGGIATISVVQSEPLAPGSHSLTLSERLRVSYLPFPAINADAKTMTLAA
ncbi:C-glycoside deglycosidase beta subunit domain-containing protein [Glacieibacterium megasporae]|uniref:C-glycoside deglycosidase beta subunit domain-containing protein n=1 Tax=Glacieibacterium megasporae TaxID=2835787 RepID=UPI001C1E6AF2|nr:DUF6379 domain-containing protein [Polymorphobacter megasporae]UAJ11093.1 DUF6379 domain-containing protein [Polymorphobacter megasporae]